MKKLKVFSNLAVSIDGKIGFADRSHAPIGTPRDREEMQVLRRRADVVVFGATTLRSFRKPCGVRGRTRQPANAVLSRSLEGIDPNWPFFKLNSMRRILFVSKLPPRARLDAFQAHSEVVLLSRSDQKNVGRAILRALSKRGLSRILVEGGGELMWEFVRDQLIDDYFVTLTPKILGGANAPTLVEGPGFDQTSMLSLKLHRVRKIGDELYLQYRRR